MFCGRPEQHFGIEAPAIYNVTSISGAVQLRQHVIMDEILGGLFVFHPSC